jgi:hypothetical protein
MEKPLCLTEDEAMSLLDIILLSPVELTAVQRSAILKLSEHCRQFLREESEQPAFPVTDLKPGQFGRFTS